MYGAWERRNDTEVFIDFRKAFEAVGPIQFTTNSAWGCLLMGCYCLHMELNLISFYNVCYMQDTRKMYI